LSNANRIFRSRPMRFSPATASCSWLVISSYAKQFPEINRSNQEIVPARRGIAPLIAVTTIVDNNIA
jgi:hypothetical protein